MSHPQKHPDIAAIVLAAGSSRRYGPHNKLLADIHGTPLIARVVERVAQSSTGQIVVVTGHDAERIEAAVSRADIGTPLSFVHNARHLEGMGTTVAEGIKALGPVIKAAIVTPGDMPDIDALMIDRLIAMFEVSRQAAIIYPALASGEQRNPVLWPRRFFPQLAALTGDAGGRHLIKAAAALVPAQTIAVPIAADASFADIDVPDELERWRARNS